MNKSITDVTEDDLIFYLAGMGSSADTQGQKVVVKTSYMGESLMPSGENIRE